MKKISAISLDTLERERERERELHFTKIKSKEVLR